MPLPPPGPTAARSAADLNEQIRELMDDAARRRVPVDAGRYHRLVVEWAEAYKAEQAGAELAA
ncbi:hypothetical protein ABT010_13600 [Streptomyces sp. NPDC002668]|uniref:hypothetical protein n=1 Tax=Streptomyces sp. NPDC002668 TaxID=3154422 RepID=UPI00332CB280